jgi:hypothetical protein
MAEHLVKAIDATASTFDGRGWQIKERWLEMMLEGALRALDLNPLRQVPLRLSDSWVGQVGGVDLGIRGEDGSLALIELKWDRRTLAACAWDAMKLAAALHRRQGDRAFLVAGSPNFDPPLRGHELLGEGLFSPSALHSKYAREFERWRGDVQNRPSRVPAGWRLLPLHSSSLRRREVDWEIRLSELILTSDELVSLETVERETRDEWS